MTRKTMTISKLALLSTLGAALAACTGGDACEATYGGNFNGTVSAPSGCGTVGASTTRPGDQALRFDLASKDGVTLAAQFDIGATPLVGRLTSEEVTDWQAIGSANNDCQYTAGATATPAGNFSLTLASVPSGSGAAHGTLHVEQYVQIPAGSDCGPGDTETVDLTF